MSSLILIQPTLAYKKLVATQGFLPHIACMDSSCCLKTKFGQRQQLVMSYSHSLNNSNNAHPSDSAQQSVHIMDVQEQELHPQLDLDTLPRLAK